MGGCDAGQGIMKEKHTPKPCTLTDCHACQRGNPPEHEFDGATVATSPELTLPTSLPASVRLRVAFSVVTALFSRRLKHSVGQTACLLGLHDSVTAQVSVQQRLVVGFCVRCGSPFRLDEKD